MSDAWRGTRAGRWRRYWREWGWTAVALLAGGLVGLVLTRFV